MIDMVFLLLVFFMTVGTMAHSERVELELAESTEGRTAEDTAGDITVSLLAGDGSGEDGGEAGEAALFLGSRAVKRAELAELLAARAEHTRRQSPNGAAVVYLRGARDVRYADVETVLRACAAAGIADIRIAAIEP